MKNFKGITDYEIWHDESKKGGYYHGLLFVPVDKKENLLSHLKRIRDEHDVAYDQEMKFRGCLDKPAPGRFIHNQLSLFKHVIQTNPKDPTKLCNRSREDIYKGNCDSFLELTRKYDCRFGLLKIPDFHDTLNYFDNYREKVETTFRFAIKGCCHGMFDHKNQVNLVKLHFDGSDHYKGELDVNRILKGNWRQYCHINKTLAIDDKHMHQRNTNGKLIMNFVDNIVGAWRALINREKDKNKVLYPLKQLHNRARKKLIFTNPNSRWYKSISLSEFMIENKKAYFPNIFRNKHQEKLF